MNPINYSQSYRTCLSLALNIFTGLFFIILGCIVVQVNCWAQAPAVQKTLVTSLQELVIGVSDLGAATKFFMNIGEWETVWLGDVTKVEKQSWNMPENQRVEVVVLKNRQEQNGYVRLLKVHNNEQVQIRSSGHIWDVGSIFALQLKVTDVQQSFKKLQLLGWHGLSDVLLLKRSKTLTPEVLIRGFDGLILHLTQRQPSAIHKIRDPKNFSPISGVILPVRSMDSAFITAVQRLGFKQPPNSDSVAKQEDPELFAVPQTIQNAIRLRSEIVTPSILTEGYIQFIQVQGVQKQRVCKPANPLQQLGPALIRFACTGLDTYYQRIIQAGVVVKRAPTDYQTEPYGKIRAMIVELPEGVLCEFFELQK